MSENNIEKIRHSLSHLLAMVVLKKYPKTVLAIGPTIENGFYYDFDLPKGKAFSENDFLGIEQEMKNLIKQNLKFEKFELPEKEALKKVKGPYKKELIKEHGKVSKKLSFYQSGNFVDLCAGPHVKSTKEINPEAFKLTKLAGAYWRGNEKNKMLTRIYGVAFATKQELDDYLKMLQEAEKRDHRKLGKELELFHIDENVGKGLPLWMPKGAIIRQTLERFIEDEETKRGYLRTYTPVIGNVKLYKISGHWEHYRDDMYPPMKIDDEEFVLRPMTCPHQFMIYKAKPHSYRELPIRYAELAEMYRREKSGELTGLIRVMGFTLSDAHLICTPEQLENEFLGALDLVKYCLKCLGIEKTVTYKASLRDAEKEKYIDNKKLWETAEEILLRLMQKGGVNYTISKGEAAFYGPKTDIQIKNVLGKEETIITIQIDLNSAERFDLSYIDKSGTKKRPVIIHRSSIGCLERTVAYLIEHFAGAFPLWLSPVQVSIMSVGSAHRNYVKKLEGELKKEGIRTEINIENETIGNKIRQAEKMKIPYMLVIGDKEMNSNKLTVRVRAKKDLWTVDKNEFINAVKNKIKDKSLDLM